MTLVMKKFLLFIPCLLLACCASADPISDTPPVNTTPEKEGDFTIKVMSYNMRVGSANDGTNSWNMRFPATGLMIKDVLPDIFGVQEALDYQVEFIEENFKNYKSIGVGRENGKKEGEFMSIFYDKNKIRLIRWGTFWLSETPEKPSKGWDAACKRTATWALMIHKESGKKFYYINTHLDHKGSEARKNGLALIISRIDSMNPENHPMILTGDFNVKPENPALDTLDEIMKSARKEAKITDNKDTYNGWGRGSGIIDYIYYSRFSECLEYQTNTKKYGDWKYISDHYPITAVLKF